MCVNLWTNEIFAPPSVAKFRQQETETPVASVSESGRKWVYQYYINFPYDKHYDALTHIYIVNIEHIL